MTVPQQTPRAERWERAPLVFFVKKEHGSVGDCGGGIVCDLGLCYFDTSAAFTATWRSTRRGLRSLTVSGKKQPVGAAGEPVWNSRFMPPREDTVKRYAFQIWASHQDVAECVNVCVCVCFCVQKHREADSSNDTNAKKKQQHTAATQHKKHPHNPIRMTQNTHTHTGRKHTHDPLVSSRTHTNTHTHQMYENVH